MQMQNGEYPLPRFRRMVVSLLLALLLSSSVSAATESQPKATLQDLFYGEALFYAYMDDYFSAITRLDTELIQHYQLDEPRLDPLQVHRNAAEFSVGDLELSYRMHQQAGRALERLFHESIDQQTQNLAAYKMARIFSRKQYYVNTLHALDLVRGEVPLALADNIAMLRAQAEMSQTNYEKAIELLKPIRKSGEHEGYAAYNLGVAYIRSGDLKKGAQLLDQVGALDTHARELLSLRDKANLTLGYGLLEQGYAPLGRFYFERVRLNGPFSNKALLWAGWADIAQEQYERALTPWSLLNERDPTDSAVQEALLALPYAYSQLQIYGKAALLYGKAVTEFNKEIERLNSSINSIQQGKLLKSLVEKDNEQNSSFLARLKDQSDSPETRYLLELMASDDFQESVKNYRDLAFQKRNLEQWQRSITAYKNLISIRRKYYEPLLPVIEEKYAVEDASVKRALEKRDYLAAQLQTMVRLRDPKALSTSAELKLQRRLAEIEARLNRINGAGVAVVRQRLQRLKGILYWNIYSEFENRLDQAHHHLKELDTTIRQLKQQQAVVVRYKREAYQSFEGYEVAFRRFSTRLTEVRQHVMATMEQQGLYIERVATLELEQRRKKLADYQIKARFALAESYDRATQKQNSNEQKAAPELKPEEQATSKKEGKTP